MQKLLSTTALAAVMAVGVIGGAAAVPLNTTFAVTVYNFNNPNATKTSGDASEQALPNAQNGTANLVTSTFNYNGALNFGSPPGANTISGFIGSGGGSVTGVTGSAYNNTLSTGGFDVTSLFKFTFSTSGAALTGTITHDDGISLYAAGTTATNLLPGNSAPTSATSTAFSIGAGSYDLYYTEANGLPAQLNLNVLTSVPEPATLALLGTGLIGLCVVGRRRRPEGNSTSA